MAALCSTNGIIVVKCHQKKKKDLMVVVLKNDEFGKENFKEFKMFCFFYFCGRSSKREDNSTWASR